MRARFWKQGRVNFNGPIRPGMKTRCWEWTGANKRGYGQVKVSAESRFAQYTHRKMWIALHGPIPPGMQVCHHCDNPPCLRPKHLFLGTAEDNLRDADTKGRLSRGARHPTSKLTAAKVLRMRSLRAKKHTPYGELATMFGVTFEAARKIILGRTWSHVPGANPDDKVNRRRDRKLICEVAAEVLRETGNPAVMWGDAGLLDTIAVRSGVRTGQPPMVHWNKVLYALSRRPGELVPGKTQLPNGRVVRIFRLPDRGVEKRKRTAMDLISLEEKKP